MPWGWLGPLSAFSVSVFQHPALPVLRHPSSACCQIACAAIRDRRDPRSPRHGLESPCHVARAFQPVGLGRTVRSAVRSPSSALRRPSSVRRPPFPPVKNPSVCSVFSVGQPSAFRPMPRGTGFPARGFGTGRTLRPPPSVLRPIAWRSLYTTAVRRLPPVLTAFHAREPSGTETHRVP